jgi:hypothetical protein
MFSSLFFPGGTRALVHGYLHRGDDGQDPGRRIHPAQGQLPQERLEHHGLHRGRLGVRFAMPTIPNLVVVDDCMGR